MAFYDDPEDEQPVPDRLLPPEDRLWRHPSELGAVSVPSLLDPAPPGRANRRTSANGALIGACLAGAMVAFGALWLARPAPEVDRHAPVGLARRAADQRGAPASDVEPSERLADQLAPTLATLRVERAGSWTTGTALWIDQRGTLAAALPVVRGATRLVVIGQDGITRLARLAGVDPATGIASLVVDRTAGTPVATTVGHPRSGEPAAVLGAPDGDAGRDHGDATMASSVVRAVSRRATVEGLLLHDAIQLDRSVPVEVVGGALVDLDGAVLGMVLGNSIEHHLGTVVSSATLLATTTSLRDEGTVHRARLGVRAVDLDRGQGQLLRVPRGAQLTEVAPDSPAAHAGLRVGDVITAIDGQPVDDASDLVVSLRAHRPGDHTVVAFRRTGTALEVTATLGV